MAGVVIVAVAVIMAATGSIGKTSFASAQTENENKMVSERIHEFEAKTKCRGVSVALVRGDEAEVYGDAEGLYQIGSMTKAFTGLAVQKLTRDGVISEEENLSEVLDGFTAYYEGVACEITIRQLLSQTSGYTNREADYPSAAKDETLMEWVDSISGKELNSKPGTEYAYSNVNYNLLGAVIEQSTGKSYQEYMENEILRPLGLTNTYVQVPKNPEQVVRGSRLGYRHCFAYEIAVAPGQIPAGYFYSNATDLARWLQIWIGTADIPEEYKSLVSAVKETFTEPGDYYSGWEAFSNGTIGHSGGTPNYSSRIVFSDEEAVGVCVLTNLNVAASTDSLCNGIYETLAIEGESSEEANRDVNKEANQRADREANKDSFRLQTDVWTIFDGIFTMLTLAGIVPILLAIFGKRRLVLIVTGVFVGILLISICVTMPLIFGAGLWDIMVVWAPYSFTGGLAMLVVDLCAIAVKLGIIRKNDH